MPLIWFFARRLLTGAIARSFTTFLVRRFRLSPSMANIVFLIVTEVLARGTEKGAGFGRKGAR